MPANPELFKEVVGMLILNIQMVYLIEQFRGRSPRPGHEGHPGPGAPAGLRDREAPRAPGGDSAPETT